MRTDCIDTVIHRALDSLVGDLNRKPWQGRERELISLFAFQHLLPTGATARPALRPGQIGIEVAVPQHPPHGRGHHKANVCKDLVIWPMERTTTWMGPSGELAYPLAVMEWKSFNNVGGAERIAEKRRQADLDVEWLERATLIAPSMRGYAVLVDLRESPVVVTCRLVHGGRAEAGWKWGPP